MSYFNNSRFCQEREPFKKNPFNESYDEGSLFPPPESDFMVTEGFTNFMKSETTTDLMITEP